MFREDLSVSTISKEEILTNPNICKRCDMIGKSCCHNRDGSEGMLTPVSENEIQKIFSSVNWLNDFSFIEKEKNTIDFIQQMLSLFPSYQNSVIKVFPETGYHYRLSVKNDKCFFLNDNGCMLPHNIKPLFCKIYPFWLFDQEPQIFQDEKCLALDVCDTVQELCLAFGTNPNELIELHEVLCQNLGLYQSKKYLQAYS